MSFIQRELERVGAALMQPQPSDHYAELYAVQQALLWALEPEGFKSPYDMIVGISIPADLKDCQAGNDHSQFSNTLDCHVS
jgi:hypothetical protein